MIIPIGILIILGSVLGGFIWGGGHPGVLFPPHEFLIIGGAALGALIIMSPKKVLADLTKGLISCMKGAPHNREGYEQLFSALYELFLVGRRNGMIALEEHILNPQNSAIFKKYPLVAADQDATEFLCGSLRPIIDGKVKPDQLRMLLDIELDRMETERHAPVSVLTRAADAMPGFGIVAAVLGIVITMASISSGPIEHIGEGVAAALVGTFLGVFIAYGFLNPLATNLEFVGAAELDFTHCIAACIVGFANGMAPITAVEVGRRGLSSELRPSADELEQLLRSLKDPGKPSDTP